MKIIFSHLCVAIAALIVGFHFGITEGWQQSYNERGLVDAMDAVTHIEALKNNNIERVIRLQRTKMQGGLVAFYDSQHPSLLTKLSLRSPYAWQEKFAVPFMSKIIELSDSDPSLLEETWSPNRSGFDNASTSLPPSLLEKRKADRKKLLSIVEQYRQVQQEES